MKPDHAEAGRGSVVAQPAAEPADAVLADPALVGGAFLLGHPLGVRPPIVMCGICPLMISSRDTAPFGMGLTPLFTVPEFEYPRSDAPATLHFAGPISASGSQAPLPPWWAELDGSRPAVHVTQGTIGNRDYGQLIAPALEGLAGEDVLVAVATGGRPVESLPPLPPNARAAEFLPYDDLLPKTDVYVTNGGYGGVQYALRYGVPIVATGRHEDKPEVIARVAWVRTT